jgi:hypothetical protein
VHTRVEGDTLHLTAPALVPDLGNDDLARHLLDVAEASTVSGIRTLVLADREPTDSRARTYRRAGYRPSDAGWVKRRSQR